MVEISKHLFESTCRDIHCSVLLHPWHRSCWASSLIIYQSAFIGSAKFYFILHLAQNLTKGQKILKRAELIKAGQYYVRSTLMGTLVGGSSVTLGCLLRWLVGKKFTYYTFSFIPGMIGSVFLILEPPKRRSLVVNLYCSLVIEYWMRSLVRAGYIDLTKTKQTFMFMVGSALLFYLMRLEGDRDEQTPLMWLFYPEKVKRKTNESYNVCPHTGPCLRYISKGALLYFGVGFGLTMGRLLLPRISSPLKVLTSIRRRHFDMALFFASYIGIYRAVICYLCRKQGYDSALYALPAGCLAGLSFLFKPSLGLAIASLTGAFKIYSTILYEKKILPENIPLPMLLYCISQGTLFHARVMHSDVCPQYVIKVFKSVSNGRFEVFYQNLLETVKKKT